MTPLVRFLMESVASNECVLWPGAIDRQGYGRFSGTGAHRVSYEMHNGPIPSGMTVDHLCFTPACVNPKHLRLLTHQENNRNQRSAMQSHCVNGHEFTPENTYLRPPRYGEGTRQCRKCNAESQARYKARKANGRAA